jgi:hypothetical protein
MTNALLSAGLGILNQPLPEDTELFSALGKFVADYASAENAVHGLARRLLRTNDAKARIVFGGMRLADLTDRIRGLLRVTKAGKRKCAEIEKCLAQLNTIAEQRNKIVHRWSYFKDQVIWVTNAPTTKDIAAIEIEPFKKDDFDHMGDDCVAIGYRLTNYGKKGSKPFIVKWARRPWRYKPAQPNPQNRLPQKDAQARPPQRLSSRQRREAAMKKREKSS